MFETYEVDIEIYLEDRLVNKQHMEAPKEILIVQFAQLVNQIGNDKRPMRVKVSKPQTIWDDFENKEKVLHNYIEFSNNAMLAFKEKR